MLNYSAVNEYTYRLRNKITGATSKNTLWCYGDIFGQIRKYKKEGLVSKGTGPFLK